MQWVAMKKNIPVSSKWIVFSFLGFGISYLLCDLVIYFFNLKPEKILVFATLSGALISAWFQYKYILIKIKENSINWIYFSTAAWVVAYAITMSLFALNMIIPKMIALPLAFIILIIGGPILGFITGKCILKIIG
jgi:hypothetical protein